MPSLHVGRTRPLTHTDVTVAKPTTTYAVSHLPRIHREAFREAGEEVPLRISPRPHHVDCQLAQRANLIFNPVLPRRNPGIMRE